MIGNVEIAAEVDEDVEVANAAHVEIEIDRRIGSAHVRFVQRF